MVHTHNRVVRRMDDFVRNGVKLCRSKHQYYEARALVIYYSNVWDYWDLDAARGLAKHKSQDVYADVREVQPSKENAQLWSSLSVLRHTNVASIYGFFMERRKFHVLLEHLPLSIYNLLPLSGEETAYVTSQMLSGLSDLDLSPEKTAVWDIRLGSQMEVKIVLDLHFDDSFASVTAFDIIQELLETARETWEAQSFLRALRAKTPIALLMRHPYVLDVTKQTFIRSG